MDHVKLLAPLPLSLRSLDGKEIDVLELPSITSTEILSSWAGHVRNHYCSDAQIDDLKSGTGKSRAEYLIDICFPDAREGFGPATRAGDITEILIADYLQYALDYLVPRLRYEAKFNRNSSTQGSDVVAFKIVKGNVYSDDDILLVYEVKSKLSAGIENKLQEAVNDAAKNYSDYRRVGVTLAALKTRYYIAGNKEAMQLIERFQDLVDRPYKQKYGAAGVFTDTSFDTSSLSSTKTAVTEVLNGTPFQDNLHLLVIKGVNMMDLVHNLYQIAAHEA